MNCFYCLLYFYIINNILTYSILCLYIVKSDDLFLDDDSIKGNKEVTINNCINTGTDTGEKCLL